MNCDACRNAILSSEQPGRPGADVLEHIAGCAECLAVQKKAAKLDALLTRLPVPSSRKAKSKLIASLNDAALAVSSTKVPLYRKLLWNPVTGIAAMLVIGVGIFFLVQRPKPQEKEFAKPRHELLNKEMQNVVRLAKADSPPARLQVWSDWATDIRIETRDLYKVAPADELSSLARMYDKAVTEGIVKQAKLLQQHMEIGEKLQLLKTADARLADTAAEAERLHGEAPPQAQKYLKQIAETSREGRRQLEPILKGGAS